MITTSQQPGRLAFTLMEMLIVLMVMVILGGLSFPLLRVLWSTDAVLGGVETIGVAVRANKPFALREVIDLGDINSDYAGATYSGTAIIFTPAGEIRLVENDQAARDDAGDVLEEQSYNGYRDIPNVKYVQLPERASVFGIIRLRDMGGHLVFLPPPFAINFDENGQLIGGAGVGSSGGDAVGPGLVVYDSNYDGLYDIGKRRKASYQPEQWDPSTKIYETSLDSNNSTKPGIHPETQRHKLPFEVLDSVIGVVVYDVEPFREEFSIEQQPRPYMIISGLSASPHKQMSKWLLKNGSFLFFNRYTGNILHGGTQ